MILEKIIKLAKQTVGTTLLAGSLALNFGCNTESELPPLNIKPAIKKIEDQIAREGKLFVLDLNPYISDPDGDSVTVRLNFNELGTIVDGQYQYDGSTDTDYLDNRHEIGFYVTDGKEYGTTYGSFNLLMEDAGITTSTEILSSGLEAIILGSTYPDETSIKVDSNDQVHIGCKTLWYSGPNVCMTLLAHLGDRWLKNNINSQGGRWNSIAIDNQDRIHVSYSVNDRNAEDLVYALFDSMQDYPFPSAIRQNYLDLGASVGLFNNICLNANQNPHMIYYDWCKHLTKHATNASGEWILEENLNGLDINHFDSLVIDSNNNFHVAYSKYDLGSYGLKYANDLTGNWQKELIDSEVCSGNSIVQNTNGLHIAYSTRNFNAQKLKYASNAEGSWQSVTIEERENFYKYANPVIAINENSIGILYLEQRSVSDEIPYGLLKFATNVSGSWQVHTLDNRATCSAHALVVDSTGRFHVSYVGENYDLRKISFTESELSQ